MVYKTRVSKITVVLEVVGQPSGKMIVTTWIRFHVAERQSLPLLILNLRYMEMVRTAEFECVVINPALGNSFKYDSPRGSGYYISILTTNGTAPCYFLVTSGLIGYRNTILS
jgi:hypothetical protein